MSTEGAWTTNEAAAPGELHWEGLLGNDTTVIGLDSAAALLAVDDPERARRRKQAKQFTHGLGYGMGPKTFAARYGLPLPAATTAP